MVGVGLGLCCPLCIWLGVVCRVVLVCRRALASLTALLRFWVCFGVLLAWASYKSIFGVG